MTNRVKVYTTQLTKEILWSSPQPISTAKLNASRHLHTQPINLVVFKGSYSLYDGISNLGVGFTLRCFQRLSVPYIAAQPCHWHDNWCTRGTSIPGPLVLRTELLKYPAPTTDRFRTVSRRSEPSCAYHFNRRTAEPLGPNTAPGC